MQDSQIAELKAPGKVDPRDIGRGTDWGNLPDKDASRPCKRLAANSPPTIAK